MCVVCVCVCALLSLMWSQVVGIVTLEDVIEALLAEEVETSRSQETSLNKNQPNFTDRYPPMSLLFVAACNIFA